MTENSYLAGYFLMKMRLHEKGWLKGKRVATCSSCINLLAFDFWCFGWGPEQDHAQFEGLDLSEDKIKAIRAWTNHHNTMGKLNWGNLLPNLVMAEEYKTAFFPDRKDIGIYKLEFPESDRERLLNDFATENKSSFNYNNGNMSIRHNLLNGHIAARDVRFEFLGFDLIGVEGDGAFHSFYCHGTLDELQNRFGIEVNAYGLFDHVPDPGFLLGYLNDPASPVERVPWYAVKVSRLEQDT